MNRIINNIYAHRILWAYMFILSWFSLIDIPSSPVFGLSPTSQTLYLITVSALKASLITAVLVWIKRFKALYWAIIILFSVVATVNLISFKFYGFGVSRRMISVFLETNTRETAEFLESLGADMLSTHQLLGGTVWILLAGMLVEVVHYSGRRLFFFSMTLLSSVGLISLLIFSLSFTSGRTAHSLFLRIAKYSSEVYRSNRELQQQLAMLAPFPENVTVESTHDASDIIVIIGESASRNHLSLYGYALPTSPLMDSMADSLFVFTDVIASSAGTSGNLERIMTFKKDDTTYGDGYKFPLIIDFFKRAGYRTYWLSNQEKVGSVSNLSGVLNSRADVIKYVGAESSEDALLTRYDEVLLPELAKALGDAAAFRFIVLHLLGSHVVYANRYPPHAARFSSCNIPVLNRQLTKDMAQTVAEYDNSIRYTDSIVGEVIKSAAASRRPSVVVYFSDHGENVYDDIDKPRRGPHTVEVPFVIFTNAAYRRQNPAIIEKLTKATDKPFSSANLIFPLITLSGTTSELYEPEEDFLNDNFRQRIRYVDELPLKPIETDTYE